MSSNRPARKRPRIKYSNSTLGDEILTWYDEVKIDPVKKLIVRKARLDIVNLPASPEAEDARADRFPVLKCG